MQNNDSQILNSPQKINLQKRLYEKTKLIEILQQKNQTLSKEVERITKMMEQSSQNKVQKVKNEDRKDIFTITSNDPQVLNKELKNCFKRIKFYEYELEKLQSKNTLPRSSDNLTKMDAQLNQQKLMQDKLKHQLNSLLRQITENSRNLSENIQKQQIQKDFKSKSDELRCLKQKIRDYQSKDAIKQKNLKTQYNHIKLIQKQFVQNGGSINELQIVKRKAISQFQEGRLVRQNPKEEVGDSRNKFSSNSISNNSLLNSDAENSNPQAELIQDRTKTQFESLLTQLSVLEKLNKKYQKQLEESEKNLKEIQNNSQLTRKITERVDKQIQMLNGSIKLKKSCIIPENMKPTHRRSERSMVARQQILNISQARQGNKRKRNIINMTAILSDREQRLYNN